MVTWYHQKIVNGYCLFEPLLLRVLIMNLQIVSLIICHSALHILFGHLFFIPYTSQVESMSSDLSYLLVLDSTLLNFRSIVTPQHGDARFLESFGLQRYCL